MTNRVSAIGYRLGEGVWWKDRTPLNTEKEGKIEKVVRGVLEKGKRRRGGYKTSEVVVQKGREQDIISLQVSRGGFPAMYKIEYIDEILKKSQDEEYKISMRRERKMKRNGELRFRAIVKHKHPIRKSMKEKRWWSQ